MGRPKSQGNSTLQSRYLVPRLSSASLAPFAEIQEDAEDEWAYESTGHAARPESERETVLSRRIKIHMHPFEIRGGELCRIRLAGADSKPGITGTIAAA